MVRPRTQKSSNVKENGPNWILVAGGALISSLSIHLGYKLKQALGAKQPDKASPKGNGNCSNNRRLGTHHSQPNIYTYVPDEDSYLNYNSGAESVVEIKNPLNGQIVTEPEASLALVTVPAPENHQENGNIWVSSPDQLELPPKRFHRSNCSDSPCASDSGSDIFSKREVIQKLRQQLKRRDDMILEMQDQIAELQNTLISQESHSTNLQSQLDAANQELFDSETEIQRLRKAIADHCVGHAECNEKNSTATVWPSEGSNGYTNGHVNGNYNLNIPEKCKGDGEKFEMLKNEIRELKEVIEGKEFLVQSYKEQKSELSIKIQELQQRLDLQIPNIL